jgi:hypothetical protein
MLAGRFSSASGLDLSISFILNSRRILTGFNVAHALRLLFDDSIIKTADGQQ